MTIAGVSSASPSTIVTVSTAGDGTAGQLGHFWTWGLTLLDNGISGPAGVPALVGLLTCGRS